MLIGVPKEIKDNEFRVGLTPASVAELTHHGHAVLVEKSAGVSPTRNSLSLISLGTPMSIESSRHPETV